MTKALSKGEMNLAPVRVLLDTVTAVVESAGDGGKLA
jgi:hypothetical protein